MGRFFLRDIEHYIVSNAAYNLVSQTALQKIFNSPSGGAFNAQAGFCYFFECGFDISAMSITAGSFSFGFLGTATFNSLKYTATASKAALSTPSMPNISTNAVATAVVISASNTSSTGLAYISGVLRVNTAGTIIPSVGLSIASAAVVGANAYFRIVPLGTNALIGNGNMI
jgi:hypothetical protein